jgi:hypothetical protein
MAVRWTAHIPMAMQQHGGGAKVPHEVRPAQPERISPVEENVDRAPPPSEAVDAR